MESEALRLDTPQETAAKEIAVRGNTKNTETAVPQALARPVQTDERID